MLHLNLKYRTGLSVLIGEESLNTQFYFSKNEIYTILCQTTDVTFKLWAFVYPANSFWTLNTVSCVFEIMFEDFIGAAFSCGNVIPHISLCASWGCRLTWQSPSSVFAWVNTSSLCTHTQPDLSVFTRHIYTLVHTWNWSVHLYTVQPVNKKMNHSEAACPPCWSSVVLNVTQKSWKQVKPRPSVWKAAFFIQGNSLQKCCFTFMLKCTVR